MLPALESGSSTDQSDARLDEGEADYQKWAAEPKGAAGGGGFERVVSV